MAPYKSFKTKKKKKKKIKLKMSNFFKKIWINYKINKIRIN